MEPASLLAVLPTLTQTNLLELPRENTADRWRRAVSRPTQNRKSVTTPTFRSRTPPDIEELRATARLYAFGLDPVPDLPIPRGSTGLTWVEFGRLADKYYLRLIKDAMKYGAGDEDTASDLVQETLAALAESHHSFRVDSEPYTWMHATLRNKIRDHLEREQRLRRERTCALAYVRRQRKRSAEDDQSQQDLPDDDAEALAEVQAEKVEEGYHTIVKSVASVLPDPLAAPPDALELAMMTERREALLKARHAVGVPRTIWTALWDAYVMDEPWSRVAAKLNVHEETLRYEARKELLALRDYLMKLGYQE